MCLFNKDVKQWSAEEVKLTTTTPWSVYKTNSIYKVLWKGNDLGDFVNTGMWLEKSDKEYQAACQGYFYDSDTPIKFYQLQLHHLEPSTSNFIPDSTLEPDQCTLFTQLDADHRVKYRQNREREAKQQAAQVESKQAEAKQIEAKQAAANQAEDTTQSQVVVDGETQTAGSDLKDNETTKDKQVQKRARGRPKMKALSRAEQKKSNDRKEREEIEIAAKQSSRLQQRARALAEKEAKKEAILAERKEKAREREEKKKIRLAEKAEQEEKKKKDMLLQISSKKHARSRSTTSDNSDSDNNTTSKTAKVSKPPSSSLTDSEADDDEPLSRRADKKTLSGKLTEKSRPTDGVSNTTGDSSTNNNDNIDNSRTTRNSNSERATTKDNKGQTLDKTAYSSSRGSSTDRKHDDDRHRRSRSTERLHHRSKYTGGKTRRSTSRSRINNRGGSGSRSKSKSRIKNRDIRKSRSRSNSKSRIKDRRKSRSHSNSRSNSRHRSRSGSQQRRSDSHSKDKYRSTDRHHHLSSSSSSSNSSSSSINVLLLVDMTAIVITIISLVEAIVENDMNIIFMIKIIESDMIMNVVFMIRIIPTVPVDMALAVAAQPLITDHLYVIFLYLVLAQPSPYRFIVVKADHRCVSLTLNMHARVSASVAS